MSNDIAKLLADVRALLTPVLGPSAPPPSVSPPAPIAKPLPHRQQVKMLREREKRKAAENVTDPNWIGVSATKKRAKAKRRAISGQGRVRNRKGCWGNKL
jgi:hypothetical protein